MAHRDDPSHSAWRTADIRLDLKGTTLTSWCRWCERPIEKVADVFSPGWQHHQAPAPRRPTL